MTAVAFIGLGIMGSPMAVNLVRAGHDVVGYNRTPTKARPLVEAGGRAATTIADAVHNADVVVTMLPDSPDVEAVTFGTQGIHANSRPGLLHIDMSTIDPNITRAICAAGIDVGVRTVDAPVSGGEQGAIDGSLSIMVGGSPTDVKVSRDVLRAMGSSVVHVGPAGAGQTVKAANQLIVAGTIELIAEAIVFLEAHGVETAPALKVLAGGLAGNRILDRKAAAMLAREFAPGFRVELHDKDLGILTSAARDVQVSIPLGAVVAQLMGALRAQGHGALDHTALLKIVEHLSGRSTS